VQHTNTSSMSSGSTTCLIRVYFIEIWARGGSTTTAGEERSNRKRGARARGAEGRRGAKQRELNPFRTNRPVVRVGMVIFVFDTHHANNIYPQILQSMGITMVPLGCIGHASNLSYQPPKV
jgi:hypothetical protein